MSKEITKESLSLYCDIDNCIAELLRARTEHNKEIEGRALFRMEGLMVATLQYLSWIMEQAEKDLGWHSVDECLPEIDEEVIVLTNNIHGKTVKGANYICFGHLVDRRYAMDYNGWNIPGVKFWMPCPKIPNQDE